MALAALALAGLPAAAEACAVCVDSAYGNRAFNWAFAFFMLTPFAVAAVLVGVLARQLRGRRPAGPPRDATESSEGAGEGSRTERGLS